jgi:hypothetical protein
MFTFIHRMEIPNGPAPMPATHNGSIAFGGLADIRQSATLSPATCRPGFLLADALTALIILSTLSLLLFTAVGRQRHASRSLADSRAVVRLSESAVIALQRRQPLQLPADAHVRITPLPDASPAGAYHWITLTVSRRRHAATLIALVPNSSTGATRP